MPLWLTNTLNLVFSQLESSRGTVAHVTTNRVNALVSIDTLATIRKLAFVDVCKQVTTSMILKR